MKLEEDKKEAVLTSDNSQGEPKTMEIKLPTGDTTSTGKKTRKSKKDKEQQVIKEADPILKANIAALIGVTNKLAAARLGELWEFHETEIEAIADPAARIFERHGFGDAAGKYSDYFMLTLAVGLPIGLRLLAGKQQKQEGGLKLAETPRSGAAARTGDNSERETSTSNKPGGKINADLLTSVTDQRLPAIADTF
jgi:hypothetical protein